MNRKIAVPTELMNDLLLSIVAFMAKTGMSAADIEQAFQASVRVLTRARNAPKSSSVRRSALPIGCDTVAGAVLRAWHREARYLDESANPLPLRIRSGSKSLVSLVHSQDRAADASSLIEEMKRTGLIKKGRDGRYLPTTSAATIRQLHPLAVDHVVKTVMRLVETVNRNTRTTLRKMPLIERYAHVPDLDSREAQAFADFTRQQGAACLEAIEDWLESRRQGTPSTSGTKTAVSAGMHVFAYLGEHDDAKARKARDPRLTSSRAIRA
jgi:hypothetical protein